MIYLYLKTHNVTGLKYLGKTISEDPYAYTGSGVYWKKHINKHGYDCTTEILAQSEDPLEIRKLGLEYSDKLNIVESKEYWKNEELRKKRSEEYKMKGIRPPSHKGLFWWTDGKTSIRALECPGEEWKGGRK
jgi:hypothetical protein